MKILFWSEGFWPHVGGIETFSQNLITGLQAKGYQFAVITSSLPGLPEEEHQSNLSIYRRPLRQGLSGDLKAFQYTLSTIKRLKQTFRPHLNHFNVAGPSFFYHLQTLSVNASPSIFTFHYLAPTMREAYPLLSQMLTVSDWVTGVSEIALARARAFMPSIFSKSSCIYNGLKMPIVSSNPLSPSSNYLLSWGRLVENKGFDLMLRAFAVLSSEYPRLRYVLLGAGPDEMRLRSLIDSLGITDRVDFPGVVCPPKILFEYIRDARLVVLPSHDLTETFGLSALEAMQMGRPVITTKNPGLNEVVIHEKTGLVFELYQECALIDAIKRLLDDFELSQYYGLSGQSHAQHLFSFEGMINAYDHLFQTIGSDTFAKQNKTFPTPAAPGI